MTCHTEDGLPRPPATILRFPRKRGRPRVVRPRHDTGTPELVMKRLKQETAEALDLCLERDLITLEQHWCGVHFRWLYTLRYGAPGVRAVDPTHLGGKDVKNDDPEWRVNREKEYHEAMQKLSEAKCAAPLMDMCIYNHRPGFLTARGSVSRAKKNMRDLEKIREGLDMLAKLWGR